ncbi:MAG: energy transducer TonB [Bacteroidota bacterium]|nr:energy transducer TonB [Bacteroidota bacterium]
MKFDKENISALTGTIIFHAIILLLLLVLVMRTPLPLPGEEGVEVNLGYAEVGMGTVQKKQPVQKKKAQAISTPKPQPVKKAKENIITQDTEKAPSIDNVKNKKDKKKPEKKEKQPEKPVIKKEEPKKEKPKKVIPKKEPEKPKVNQRALYKGNSKTNKEGSSEGTTGEQGDQGSTFGNIEADSHKGIGGMGNGISFSLGGRKNKHLPKPLYISKDQGKVVVEIWVDRYGKVTNAKPGAKGTTVSDQRLHKVAQEAALRAKFSTDLEAPEIQKGTITYNFIRMN